MSRWMFIMAVPVRRSSPMDRVSDPCLQSPKCWERSFRRCNDNWICHNDLETPICIAIKLSISPRICVASNRPTLCWLAASIANWVAVSYSSGHVQNDTRTQNYPQLVASLLLVTVFNNLKQKACFNLSPVFEFLSLYFFYHGAYGFKGRELGSLPLKPPVIDRLLRL